MPRAGSPANTRRVAGSLSLSVRPGFGTRTPRQHWKPAGLFGKSQSDIGRILHRQSLCDTVHDAPRALAGAIIGELFVEHCRIHPRESWNKIGGTDAPLAMTGRTIQCNKFAMLGIPGVD